MGRFAEHLQKSSVQKLLEMGKFEFYLSNLPSTPSCKVEKEQK